MTKSPLGGGMVNRIPPSIDKTTKRCCNGGNNSTDKGNSNSSTSNGSNNNENERNRILDSTKKHDSKRQKMDWDIEQFAKLNPNENDVHAQRIASRYKMILKGKNTVGYDQYIQQVPKDSRRIRSMETPNTPDHTLDIPSKRWQGLVKAWRVALHKYDPPDLVTRLSLSQDDDEQYMCNNTTIDTTMTKTPIRCVSTGKKNTIDTNRYQLATSPTMEDTTPISMSSSMNHHHSPMFDDDNDVQQGMNDEQHRTARNLDFNDVTLTNDNDDDIDDSDDDLI